MGSWGSYPHQNDDVADWYIDFEEAIKDKDEEFALKKLDNYGKAAYIMHQNDYTYAGLILRHIIEGNTVRWKHLQHIAVMIAGNITWIEEGKSNYFEPEKVVKELKFLRKQVREKMEEYKMSNGGVDGIREVIVGPFENFPKFPDDTTKYGKMTDIMTGK